MTLAGSFLKKALKTDTIILRQSRRPISIKLALRKLLGLFVRIRSINMPFCDLTHVTPFTRLESEKVSGKWLFVSPFFRLSKLIFKFPITSIFSYILAILHNDLFHSIKNIALLLLYGGL